MPTSFQRLLDLFVVEVVLTDSVFIISYDISIFLRSWPVKWIQHHSILLYHVA